MDRKEKANEKYRRLFYERGLDKCFEYIAFESKDHIRVKCKQCGAETIRAKDAFVGRQTRLICKGCKSGSLLYFELLRKGKNERRTRGNRHHALETNQTGRWHLSDLRAPVFLWRGLSRRLISDDRPHRPAQQRRRPHMEQRPAGAPCL